jgi:hypothetical protein
MLDRVLTAKEVSSEPPVEREAVLLVSGSEAVHLQEWKGANHEDVAHPGPKSTEVQ